MHQDYPIRDINNLHVVKMFDGLNDLLPMLLATRVDDDVTRNHTVTHTDDIHGANEPVGFPNRGGDPLQLARLVRVLEANGYGVGRAVVNHELYLILRPP